MLLLAIPQDVRPNHDGDHYGIALCVVGDVDMDGVADFAVGETSVGTVQSIIDLRSGASGKRIWRIETVRTDANTYVLKPAGDIDRDQVPDLLFSTPYWTRPEGEEGSVRVLSGVDGRMLRTFQDSREGGWFGASICGNVDFDRDGTPDIVVGQPMPYAKEVPAPCPRVFVYSGADGRVLLDLESIPHSRMGWSIASGHDFDRDGMPDILTTSAEGLGRPTWAILSGKDGHCIDYLLYGCNSQRSARNIEIVPMPHGSRPRVLISFVDWGSDPGYEFVDVHDGWSRYPTSTITSPDPGGLFGIAMTASSDVDGDGVKDIVVGAPESQKGGWCAGEVSAWSGANGRMLWRTLGDNNGNGNLGATLAGGLDLDGDCCEDILAGAVWVNGAWETASVWVISGKSGKRLRKIERDTP